MAIKVQAKSKGYYGCLREPGEEFEVENESQVGSWMEVVGGKAKKTDDDALSAGKLAEKIKESEDLEFLAEAAKDERKTVKEAAEKRIKELQG
jgi:RNase H-fold protein (predicted Holliday junction resolvase)